MGKTHEKEPTSRLKQAQWCKAYFAVLRDPSISPTAKLVLILLRSYCRFNQDTCWPSQERMRAEAGIAQSTLTRALKELEKKGCIKRKHRRSPYQTFASTLYTILDERKAIIKEAFAVGQKHTTAHVDQTENVKFATAKALRKKIVRFPVVRF